MSLWACCYLVSVHSAWRAPSGIGCREGMLATHSLNVYLGIAYFLLYFQRIDMLGIGWLTGRFFVSFSTLHMAPCCLLDSMISSEKSNVNLIYDQVYMMNCFCLAALKTVFLSLKMFFIMYPGILWVYFIWSLLSSWMCRLMVLIKFGKYSGIISSNVLTTPFSSCFLSGTIIVLCCTFVCFGTLDGVPQALLLFLHSFSF